MRKWLARIIGSIIATVAAWWLTEGIRSNNINSQRPSSTETRPLPPSDSTQTSRPKTPRPKHRISGIWKVVQSSKAQYEMFPTQSISYWEIRFTDGRLFISEIQEFHMPRMYWSKNPIKVSNVEFSANKVSFITYVSDEIQKTTTLYDLSLTGDEIMDGSFQSTDRGVPELPDLVTAGTVRMVKQAAPNL
jgi:hypothetical protein